MAHELVFDRTFAAVYTPCNSVIQSDALRENGLPVLLLEGSFPAGTVVATVVAVPAFRCPRRKKSTEKTKKKAKEEIDLETRCINLYDHYGMPAPEKSVGTLTAFLCRTSPEISPSRKRPAVLIIPGGGYAMTSDREADPIALRFLSRGYVPFVLRYSCAPNRFPTQLREAAMAMRYIRDNAKEYEVNASMVAAIGFSAGGHLCGTIGTMFDCPEVQSIAPARMLRPDALALCYPVTVGWGATHEGTMENISGGDQQLRQRLSLDRQVRPDMPPTFLWHSRDDDRVPCRNSLILAQAMDEAGVDFTLHLYRHGWHGLSTADAQVYRTDVTPECSWDVPGWLESCVRFWEETGFAITDA